MARSNPLLVPLLLGGVFIAIALNLAFCRWGVDLEGASMLTVNLSDPPEATPDASGAVGLFTAPWTSSMPGLAWGLGVALPIVVLLTALAAAYARSPRGSQGSEADD